MRCNAADVLSRHNAVTLSRYLLNVRWKNREISPHKDPKVERIVEQDQQSADNEQ